MKNHGALCRDVYPIAGKIASRIEAGLPIIPGLFELWPFQK
jgi:hypothetical protein